MYEITVTDDFVRIISELPLKYKPIVDNSFLSIKRIESNELKENRFYEDLEKIKGGINYAISVI